MENPDAEKIRSAFLEVLRSRRTAEVLPIMQFRGPLMNPLYQGPHKPSFSEAMESCPRKDIINEMLLEKSYILLTEDGEQGRLPILILTLKQEEEPPRKRPTVVFLHGEHKCKEWLRPLLEAYASRGYIAVAVDARYHGERAKNQTTYQDALVSAWVKGDTMPFIFDTVWDLIKLADHLTKREDVDPSRIGITGESLGGMHAWFAAAVDIRYSVVVPINGVQGFGWAIEEGKWQAQVDSMKAVFEKARTDLGKDEIDKEVVGKVWDRIAPGLASRFDSPHTIPAIAPRPLLLLNGKDDPFFPFDGLELLESTVWDAYSKVLFSDFKLIAQRGVGHDMTSYMVRKASDWFDRHLRPKEDHLGKKRKMEGEIIKYLLMVTVTFLNVVNLRPHHNKGYMFKVQCTTCEKIFKDKVCIHLDDLVTPRRRKNITKDIHLLKKCKLCQKDGTVTMARRGIIPIIEASGESTPIMLFECDGLRPLDFEFGLNWTIGAPNGHVVRDASFISGQYEGVDDCGNPIKIFDVHSYFKELAVV